MSTPSATRSRAAICGARATRRNPIDGLSARATRRLKAALLSVALTTWGCTPHRGHEAGFWFDPAPLSLSPAATDAIGGPITEAEAADVQGLARRELQAAFAEFAITITHRREAFWRVAVGSMVPVRRRAPFPAAGETWAMGRFGGYSHVGSRVLAHSALTYAPLGASREEILRGIGRGIGRTAAHELAHAILGPSSVMDTRDELSYEFHSFAREAHYYGDLHWSTARSALTTKLGAP